MGSEPVPIVHVGRSMAQCHRCNWTKPGTPDHTGPAALDHANTHRPIRRDA